MSAEEIRNWTEEEDAQLMEWKAQRVPAQTIADRLGRTVNAVNFRAAMLRRERRQALSRELHQQEEPVELPEVPVEEYSPEQMRAATRNGGRRDRGNYPSVGCADSSPDKGSLGVTATPQSAVPTDPFRQGGRGELQELTEDIRQVRAVAERLVAFSGSSKNCAMSAALELGRLDVLTEHLMRRVGMQVER